VKEHAFFEREGNDLRCVVPISLVQATLGAEITVPTLRGDQALKVPEGTQSGSTIRLKNQGVPVLNGRGTGDLFVEVRVQTPTKLTKRQKELLQELGTTLRVENSPQKSSIFGKVKEIFS
jgi:molecular chaperone DnaJ